MNNWLKMILFSLFLGGIACFSAFLVRGMHESIGGSEVMAVPREVVVIWYAKTFLYVSAIMFLFLFILGAHKK
jgi:hypothetical protein